MLIDKGNKDYRINSFNVRSIIILSTFAILLVYLSNTFLFGAVKQIWADSVVDIIPVGSEPVAVAYNSNNNDIYVANENSNTVSVIDSSTNTVVDTIPVGNAPEGVAYNSNNNDIYVVNVSSGTVSVIDSSNNTVIATITAGIIQNVSIRVAYNSNNNDIYVTNFSPSPGTVSVIDSSTNTVVDTIPVGSDPVGVAYNSNNNDIYVANENSNTVSVIASPPIANAGSNQTVHSFQTVHLNGSASYDPSGFTPLTYQWTQTSGPSVSLSNPTSPNPSFTAPIVNSDTDITFQLVVENSKNVQSSPSNVTITIEPPVPPIANAGSNQTVHSFQTVHLNGSAIYDPSGFTPLTYQWTQTTGTNVTLSNPSSPNPSFTAPLVNSETNLTFQLIVTNTKGISSNPSYVTITIEPSNGNVGSSIGGAGGNGGSAIAHSGNANGGAGGNSGSEIGGQHTGDNNSGGGSGGNGGLGRHSGSATATSGNGGHGGSAGN